MPSTDLSADEAYELALRYLNGHGVERDPGAALRLFESAASRGHAAANWQMGIAYNPVGLARIYGIAGDRKVAHAYWLKAAELGERRSMWLVANEWSSGYTGGVPRASELAVQWYLKLVDGDDEMAVNAMVGLADLAMKGKQKDTAARWYERAARRGDAYALGVLEHLAKEGIAVRLDDDESLALDRQGAAKGDAAAAVRLARRYERGTSVPRDAATAYAYYLLAQQCYDLPKGRPGDATEGAARLAEALTTEEKQRGQAILDALIDATPSD